MKILNKKGISLIETIIYAAIFAMFVTSLSLFVGNLSSARIKNQMMLEVNYQGNQIIHNITNSIRSATSTNTPSYSSSSADLSLAVSDAPLNPTLYYVATGTLYIKEGGNDPVALTNNRVSVEGFSVVNTSRVSTPGNLKIRFTLKNNSSFTRPEEQYSKDFYAGASIR